MIDDQIDTEFEALLKATLNEMIPKAHAAARATTDHDVRERSHLVPPLPRLSLAGAVPRRTSRRAVGVAAAVLAAASIATLVVVRDHNAGTTPGASVPDQTGQPSWYPLLSAALPARFDHVALTIVDEQQVFLVAIEPDDGKTLEIELASGGYSAEAPTTVDATGTWVETAQGWSVQTPGGLFVRVTCDIGARGRDFPGPPNYCDMPSTGAFTKADIRSVVAHLAELVPVKSIGATFGTPATTTLNSADVTALMSAAAPGQALIADTTWGTADRVLDYSATPDQPQTSIRVITGVYPPASDSQWPFALYDDAAAFWRFNAAGTAVRISTTSPQPEALAALEPLTTAILHPHEPTSTPADPTSCSADAGAAVVPDVRTLPFDAASAKLTAAGFVVQGGFESTPVGDAGGSDPVIRQSVAAGSTAECGSTINLTVPYQPGELYAIRPGDTYFSIAAALAITPDELLAFNGLTEDELTSQGQTLDTPLEADRALRTSPIVAHDGS